MSYRVDNFAIISTEYGRLDYAKTEKDALAKLKRRKAAATNPRTVYLVDSRKPLWRFSMDGKTWRHDTCQEEIGGPAPRRDSSLANLRRDHQEDAQIKKFDPMPLERVITYGKQTLLYRPHLDVPDTVEVIGVGLFSALEGELSEISDRTLPLPKGANFRPPFLRKGEWFVVLINGGRRIYFDGGNRWAEYGPRPLGRRLTEVDRMILKEVCGMLGKVEID